MAWVRNKMGEVYARCPVIEYADMPPLTGIKVSSLPLTQKLPMVIYYLDEINIY
jgi:hypothetical protein